MRGRNLNLMAFVIICGTIAYYDLKQCHRLPWPPRFIFAGLTFLLMEAVSIFDEQVAGVVAVGMVIAILLKDGFVSDCEHGAQTGQPQTAEFLGDFTGPQQGIASVSEYQSGQASSTQQTGGATTV
jgi:hypothetical protein